MAKHFKYGGSTHARTEQCAAWHALSETVPKRLGSSEYADEGTLLHNCAEDYVRLCKQTLTWINVDIYKESINFEKPPHYNNVVLTPELFDDKLAPALRDVQDLLNEHGFALQHVHLEPLVSIDEDIGGSIDVVAINDTKLLIADYKFGFHAVSVVDNSQLQFYALNALIDDKFREAAKNVNRVITAIIQPTTEDTLRQHTYSMDEIDLFEERLHLSIEAAEASDAADNYNAGSWCRYCPAQAVCPAKTGMAAKAKLLDLEKTEQLSEALHMLEPLEDWIRSVRQLAHEQLELGNKVKGFKLVNKRARRVWNDENKVGTYCKNSKKIKLEEAFKTELKSPAQLEKIFKEKGIDFASVSDYISSVSSGTTIALEEDKRQEAVPIEALRETLKRLN